MPGDIIKVGRVKFAVKEIAYEARMQVDRSQDDDFCDYEDIESLME